MSQISTYQASYQSSNIGSTKKTAKTQNSDKTLSKKAEQYLEKLKKKYGNMEFVIKDYENEEEAQKYLSDAQSTKDYTCLIDTETLEKMATDEATREKYESVLSGAEDKFSVMKNSLGEDMEKVTAFGITIDKAGIVSYFAEVDKAKEKQEEQVKQTEKKEKKNESVTKVKADSIKKLIEKVKQELLESRTNRVQTKEEKMVGQFFDLTM